VYVPTLSNCSQWFRSEVFNPTPGVYIKPASVCDFQEILKSLTSWFRCVSVGVCMAVGLKEQGWRPMV